MGITLYTVYLHIICHTLTVFLRPPSHIIRHLQLGDIDDLLYFSIIHFTTSALCSPLTTRDVTTTIIIYFLISIVVN